GDLGRAPPEPGAVRDRIGARPPPGGARAPRPADRLPARALGLAGGDHRPHLRCAEGLPRPGPARPMMLAAVIQKPPVDWFALSPVLALLAASGVCLLGAVSVPAGARRPFSAWICALG